MPSSRDEAAARLYHRRLLTIRARTGLVIAQLWAKFAGPSDAELDQYVRHVLPVVAAARTATVDLVAAYLTAVTDEPAAIDKTGVLAGIRNGAPLDDVYRRAVITLRKGLSDGRDYSAAFSAGRARAVSTGQTDVMLANRSAAVDGMSDTPRIVGYRRVLSGVSCAFCATASSQRYYSNQLAPMHAACDCGIVPIIGDRDPGQVINKQLLGDLKQQGGPNYWEGRYKVDADGSIIHADGKPLQVAVHEHGELGPVLTDKSHDFTSASDL